MIGEGGAVQGNNLERKLMYIDCLVCVWYRSFSTDTFSIYVLSLGEQNHTEIEITHQQ
jgi:hypothetical protein